MILAKFLVTVGSLLIATTAYGENVGAPPATTGHRICFDCRTGETKSQKADCIGSKISPTGLGGRRKVLLACFKHLDSTNSETKKYFCNSDCKTKQGLEDSSRDSASSAAESDNLSQAQENARQRCGGPTVLDTNKKIVCFVKMNIAGGSQQFRVDDEGKPEEYVGAVPGASTNGDR